MKRINKILKKLTPGFFGLLIYFTIRAITDSADLSNHFKSGWILLSIEFSCSILLGYIYFFITRYFSKKMSSFGDKKITPNRIIREFAFFYLYIFIATNSTFTVMAAVTDDGLSLHDFVVINIVPILYELLVIAVMRGNYFINAYVENKIQFERLARDKAEEELKFLKGQFQPHFLFNALNTIYFQMDESIDGAKASIEKLSDLLRYRLYDDDSAMVPLSKEIEYLEKYIEFQGIRSSESLKITKELVTSLNGETVYPFLFLPLVENAFKYVSGEMWISVQLKINEEKVLFKVENSIDNELVRTYSQGGIGLQNLEKRLKLLYADNFEMNVNTNGNSFMAQLQLNLQKSKN